MVVMAGNAVLLKVASNVGPEGALIAEHIAAAGPLIPFWASGELAGPFLLGESTRPW